jgi:hypothetical protein
MPKVIVQTDDGREVSSFDVPMTYPGNGLWARMVGRYVAPLGWLGRALRDAEVIQAGGDPERLSERAMRLMAEERDAAYRDAIESGDADIRNMRP